MKVVIDIPDGCYEELTTANFPIQDAYRLVAWIIDGTPLPKGHGRLIDAEDVKRNHEKWIGYLDDDMIARLNIAIDNHVKTIIEADKAESEDEQ